ncbi:ferritin-like domain-containing protein [Lacrimispora sp. JR3]|uniref:ferritin-like domain-containing protein n=1 Tax=Lacrimispora sinapis TaxID=3111456 RepID=UPI00374A1D82
MDLSTLVFEDSSPWPSIEVDSKNQRYAAAILSNIGACNSEMSAISLYVYNSLLTKSYFSDIAECFHRIGIVEMHHLNVFGELSILLGADPRLWSYQNGRMQYWSPACNRYPTRIGAIVTNALNGELEAIKKYQSQVQWIEDSNIKAILNRVTADELCHVEILRFILAELHQDSFIQSAELRSNDKMPEDAEPAQNAEAAAEAKAIDDTESIDD